MDGLVSPDERCRRGRRSRVVLAPRRWRSKLADDDPLTTGARKPGPWGEREIGRKAIAQGRPQCPAEPVVPSPCFFIARGPRVSVDTRPSLRPLMSEGSRFTHNSGASAPRGGGLMLQRGQSGTRSKRGPGVLDSGVDAPHRPGMTTVGGAYSHQHRHCYSHQHRHCEAQQRRSNPESHARLWIASLRSQ
jgi:hypothetical protein